MDRTSRPPIPSLVHGCSMLGVILRLSSGLVDTSRTGLFLLAFVAAFAQSRFSDAQNDSPATKPADQISEPSAKPSAGRSLATFGIPQVGYINEMVRRGWQDHGLLPSPPASDSEWSPSSPSSTMSTKPSRRLPTHDVPKTVTLMV